MADFGLARILGLDADSTRLTDSALAMGTAHYMAPEQVERPKQANHHADIYSVGVVFYDLLPGELPLGRFRPPSRKTQVDVRVDGVVLKVLEKEPQRRYQAADEVKWDVDDISSHPQVSLPIPPPAAGGPTRRWLRAAAITALADVAVQLPGFGLLIFSLVPAGDEGTGTLSGVTWVSASLVLVVLSSLVVWNLRTLLEQRFGFRRASPFLLTLIILTVVWFLGGVVSFLGPISEGFTVLLTLGISVPWGLGHIAVGVLLLRWHGVFEASTRGIVGRTDERNRPARPARCRRGKNRGHRREPRPAFIAWWIDRIVGMNVRVSSPVADTASTRMGSLDSEPIRMLSCSGVVVARASGSLLLGIRRGRRRIGRRS